MTTKRKGAKKSAALKPKVAAKGRLRGAMAVASDSRKTVKERVSALAGSPLEACKSDLSLQAMLGILRNQQEPAPVRHAALRSLQAASFSVVAFESGRGDYIATMRQVAEDPDLEIRQSVLGILAREKDGFAQKRLLEGLKDPDKALLPPEKALQLLSYDVHADAYAAARAILANPPNPAAKREALRLLSADAASASVLEAILRDKNESAEIRQVAAAALHAIQPEKMQALAREMVLDGGEQDSIQTTSLTALTHFGNAETIAADSELLGRVRSLASLESPGLIQEAAGRFLNKHSH